MFESVFIVCVEAGGDRLLDGVERVAAVVSGREGRRASFDRAILGPEDGAAVGRALRELAGDCEVCLTHDVAHCTDVLRRHDLDALAARLMDVSVLSAICHPEERPAGLAEMSGEGEDRGGVRAASAATILERCDGLAATAWRLIDGLDELPPVVLHELGMLLSLELGLQPYRRFFSRVHDARRERGADASGNRLTDILPENRQRPRPRPDPETAAEQWQPLDTTALRGLLAPDGAFAAALETYEPRDGQVTMLSAVAEALNASSHLLVEAGTGIGKSVAYLVPAVLWAVKNNTPVIVSTNTKNLQSQLFFKDLPLIRRVLHTEFEAALLKGRMNYLCVRKLLYVLRQGAHELESSDELLALAGVLVWLAATRTGDFAELESWEGAAARGLPGKLTSTGEECMGRACRNYRNCYLAAARARAQAADVIVANHSLVFAEMGMKTPALPPYAHLIFDEAHNIEDAATKHFSIEVSASRIRFVLNRLYRAGRRRRSGRGTGLLPSLVAQLGAGGLTGELDVRDRALTLAQEAVKAVTTVPVALTSFLEALAAVLDRMNRESVRFRSDSLPDNLREAVLESKLALVAALARVKTHIKDLSALLRDVDAGGLAFQMEIVRDLDAMQAWLDEVAGDVDFVMAADSDSHVYWIERFGPRPELVRAWAAPVSVGERLRTELYASKKSVVFSSATLAVGRSFDFIKRRMGLDELTREELVEVNAGSPFDYPNQCLILVPMFLPEPTTDGGGDYAEELGVLLADVFRCTRGRGMALFTSYAMLKRTTRVLDAGLDGSGIRVLAQGAGGSREHITESFRNDLASVLMGTHSFWEGVDLVGETLSCLVLARLPFAVFTDPIHEARGEALEAAGQSAFFNYSLPGAVIRFRQGFGRLIRHRNDRGVVIVADRRIFTRRYGQAFRRSLPAEAQAVADRDGFLNAVRAFLDGDEG